MAAKFEIAAQGTGQFNWVLKSQGRTLATGESYTRKVSAEKAIESLRKAAAGATVSDLTLKPKAAPAKAAAKPAKATAKKSAATATKRATKAAGAARKSAPRKRAPRSA